MTTDPVDSLNELAGKVDDAFGSQRQSNEFKTISLVIDTSRIDRPTLIVHVDGEEASELADRIEEYLTEQGAQTQREYYSDSDIRVLATVD